MRSQGNVVRDTLRIGILQSLHLYLDLPAILHTFHSRYPEVEFSITSPVSDRASALVRSGALDLALHPEHMTSRSTGLEVLPFREDALVAISSAGSSFLTSSSTSLEALARAPIVDLVPERALRKVVDRGFHGGALQRESRYEVSEIESLLEFVGSDLGVAIVPSLLARSATQLRTLKVSFLRQTKVPLPTWWLVILTRQKKKPLPAGAPLSLFLAALLKRFKPTKQPDSEKQGMSLRHCC